MAVMVLDPKVAAWNLDGGDMLEARIHTFRRRNPDIHHRLRSD